MNTVVPGTAVYDVHYVRAHQPVGVCEKVFEGGR